MPEVGWLILVLIACIVVLKLLSRTPIWPTLRELRSNHELREWGGALTEIIGWIRAVFIIAFVCVATLLVVYSLVRFVRWAWYN